MTRYMARYLRCLQLEQSDEKAQFDQEQIGQLDKKKQINRLDDQAQVDRLNQQKQSAQENDAEESKLPHRTEHNSGFQIKPDVINEARLSTNIAVQQKYYEARLLAATEVFPGAVSRDVLEKIVIYFNDVIRKDYPYDKNIPETYCLFIEKCAKNLNKYNYLELSRFVQRLWEYMMPQATRNALERICAYENAMEKAKETETKKETEKESVEKPATESNKTKITTGEPAAPFRLLIHLMDIFEDERSTYPYAKKTLSGKIQVTMTNRRQEKQIRLLQDIADICETYPKGLKILDNVIDKRPEKREITRQWYQLFMDLIDEARLESARYQTPDSPANGAGALQTLNACVNLANAAYNVKEVDSDRLLYLTRLDPNAANNLVLLLKKFEEKHNAYYPVPINTKMLNDIDFALANSGTFRERVANRNTGKRDFLSDYHNRTADHLVFECNVWLTTMTEKAKENNKN